MKLNVVVLFGGQSSEHEISCLSAKTIMEAMDSKKYNLYPVYVAKDGQWSLYNGMCQSWIWIGFQTGPCRRPLYCQALPMGS